MRAIIENMISQDYVLCYIPGAFDIPGYKIKISKLTGKEVVIPLIFMVTPLWFENFRGFFLEISRFWNITSHNFQRRMPVMTLGGVFTTIKTMDITMSRTKNKKNKINLCRGGLRHCILICQWVTQARSGKTSSHV